MYVDDQTYTTKGKTYRRVLLRQSYRDENGKTKQHLIGNISHCDEDEILAVKYALKNRGNLDFLRQISGAKTKYWKIAPASFKLPGDKQGIGQWSAE